MKPWFKNIKPPKDIQEGNLDGSVFLLALQAEGHRFEPCSSHPRRFDRNVRPFFVFRGFKLNDQLVLTLKPIPAPQNTGSGRVR